MAPPNTTTTRSAYGLAIDATRTLLIERAAAYRWLVIAVTVGGAVSMLCAFAVGPKALAGLLLLPCLVLVFIAMDRHAVNCWRERILDTWSTGALRFDLLAQTLRQVPGLPGGTLSGLLSMLPSDGESPHQGS
jgi:hypothetical protein